MKLNDLKKAAAKARQDLQVAERKVAELQRNAKAAKAKAEQARLEHKRVRKAAKQAKKLALAAEEQARERYRVWEKAQKRLAKALKKLAKAKGGGTKKPALAAECARESHGDETGGKEEAAHPANETEAGRRQAIFSANPRRRVANPGWSGGLICAGSDLAAATEDALLRRILTLPSHDCHAAVRGFGHSFICGPKVNQIDRMAGWRRGSRFSSSACCCNA